MIICVQKCTECPCYQQADPATCAIATPKCRPITGASDRPSWCPLRKENVILRENPQSKP